MEFEFNHSLTSFLVKYNICVGLLPCTVNACYIIISVNLSNSNEGHASSLTFYMMFFFEPCLWLKKIVFVRLASILGFLCDQLLIYYIKQYIYYVFRFYSHITQTDLITKLLGCLMIEQKQACHHRKLMYFKFKKLLSSQRSIFVSYVQRCIVRKNPLVFYVYSSVYSCMINVKRTKNPDN